MSNTIDRLTGLGGDVATKAPCRVATTANITLSGLQTIDGETLVANDRVLVKDQSTTSENGIWVASSTAWSRAADFNGSGDVVNGTLVLVAEGSDPGRLYKADVTNPVVIGTDAIAFSYAELANAIAPGSVDTTELADEAVTEAKLDPAVAAGLSVGKHMIPILAAAMQTATTNGASASAIEATTNKTLYRTLDFDQTTQEFAGFVLPMPKSWNESTITFRARWTAASGSGTVVWALQAVAVSDDDAIDVAYGTEQTSTDTLITAGDMHTSPESSAITIGGTPVEGDVVLFRVKRVPASDDLNADARLIAVDLFITTNDGTDD